MPMSAVRVTPLGSPAQATERLAVAEAAEGLYNLIERYGAERVQSWIYTLAAIQGSQVSRFTRPVNLPVLMAGEDLLASVIDLMLLVPLDQITDPKFQQACALVSRLRGVRP